MQIASYTVLPILALFRESRDKNDARAQRDAIIDQFGDVHELKKALNVIRCDDLEHMIVYLSYQNLDKTNNSAEREMRLTEGVRKSATEYAKQAHGLNHVRLQSPHQHNQRSAERSGNLILT
ncbi:MAG: hypothetical protein JXB30_07180 [Anaerolineae bacterium]|nr:hypothetical protein [Anaerolineae bacterium]